MNGLQRKNRQESMDYVSSMLEENYPYTAHYQTMYVYNAPKILFTPEECDRIIRIGHAQRLEPQRNQYQLADVSDFYMHVAYIPPCPETEFVYDRLWELIVAMNTRYWNFELYDFAEPLKFTEYEKTNGTCIHTDNNMHDSIYRKLTVIVQLSEETNYVGGEVVIYNTKYPKTLFKQRGTVAIFPTYILHKVEPILCGMRNSLVAFAHGPPFR